MFGKSNCGITGIYVAEGQKYMVHKYNVGKPPERANVYAKQFNFFNTHR